MEIISSMAGWEFLLRYMHFLAGVCWIGVLWYFNFIQTPFFGTELGGQERRHPGTCPQCTLVVSLGRHVHLPERLGDGDDKSP